MINKLSDDLYRIVEDLFLLRDSTGRHSYAEDLESRVQEAINILIEIEEELKRRMLWSGNAQFAKVGPKNQ